MSKKKRTIISCICGLLIVLIVAGVFVFCFMTHSVTFYSDVGQVIKIDEVGMFKAAEPPVSPTVSYGNIFKKWDADFGCVTKDLEIHPICEEFSGKKNVFALSGGYFFEDGYINIPLQLCGDVCLSGFEIIVKYDSDKLQLESVYDEDGGVVINSEKSGEILINYVSLENTIGDVDICNFKFSVVGKQKGESPISIDVQNVYKNGKNEKIVETEYTLIDSVVYF